MFRSPTAAALIALSLASAATAQPAPDNAVHIKVTSADLQTPDGARKLAFRIWLAADRVCGGNLPHGREAADFDSCRDDAIRHAYAGVNAPMLAQALGLNDGELAQSRK